jgi:hypothetical protein
LNGHRLSGVREAGMRARRLLSFAVVLVLSSGAARAGLFGRSRLASRWTAVKIAVNGDDAEWIDSSAFEEDGLSILAMNDAESLYLLLTAHTREARDQLSGESHQDLTLWFVGLDGKTREWGARIPFSRRAPLTSALRDPAGLDPEPELVRYQGAQISSDTLPGEVADRLAAAGRRPIWELKIPLKRVSIMKERIVDVDFVLNAPPGGAKRVSPARAEKGEERQGHHPEELVWNAQSYSLSIRLAPDPSQPR